MIYSLFVDLNLNFMYLQKKQDFYKMTGMLKMQKNALCVQARACLWGRKDVCFGYKLRHQNYQIQITIFGEESREI